MDKVVPHYKAPTIDHLIPISEDGEDAPANVQLAHFICNSIRGAGGVVQLALIG
jgi:5-methylcytosine-specific restriction endonuclease McrA